MLLSRRRSPCSLLPLFLACTTATASLLFQVQGSVSRHLAKLERHCSRRRALPDQIPGLQTRWVQNGQVGVTNGLRFVTSHLEWNSLALLLSFFSPFISRTKIFIRHPRTLFATEDAFQVCKHKLGETRPVDFHLWCSSESQKTYWAWKF